MRRLRGRRGRRGRGKREREGGKEVARRQARVLVRAPASNNKRERAKWGERSKPCKSRVRGGGKMKGGRKEGGEGEGGEGEGEGGKGEEGEGGEGEGGEGEGGKEVARRQARVLMRALASDNKSERAQ